MENTNPKIEFVPTEVFTCCKCGALLFRKDQLLTHKPLGYSTSFENKSKKSHACSSCMSHFISSCPPWVKNQDQIECKIYCPNCGTRVGMLHWQGTQCSCGQWVTPAIQFPVSRVDLKTVNLPVKRKVEEPVKENQNDKNNENNDNNEENENNEEKWNICFNTQ